MFIIIIVIITIFWTNRVTANVRTMAHRVLDFGRNVHDRRLGIFNIWNGENIAVELQHEKRSHERLIDQRIGNAKTVENRTVFVIEYRRRTWTSFRSYENEILYNY